MKGKSETREREGEESEGKQQRRQFTCERGQPVGIMKQ